MFIYYTKIEEGEGASGQEIPSTDSVISASVFYSNFSIKLGGV